MAGLGRADARAEARRGVALPTIQRDLGLSQTALQWTVNAYLLALAALVAVGGRLGYILGQVPVFKLGAVVFVIASALCGIAQGDWQLFGARVLQGVGAAAIVPASQAIVTNTFSASERGKAMGAYAGISMICLALGPLLGGVLTEDVTWRAVFWVNLPVGAAMLVAAHTTLRDEQAIGGRMDWPGTALLVPGLALLVLGLMRGQDWGWASAAVIAVLSAATMLLLGFGAVELRRRAPLIDLRLLRSRNFAIDSLVAALVQFALAGFTVFGAEQRAQARRTPFAPRIATPSPHRSATSSPTSTNASPSTPRT